MNTDYTMLSLEYTGFAMLLLDGGTLSTTQAARFALIKQILIDAGKM
jgi:hypothetical protein